MGPNERIGHDEAPSSEHGEAPAAVEEADQGKLVADAAGNLSHRLRALSDLGVLAGGAVSLSGVADQLQKTAEALNTSAPSSGLVKDRLAGYRPTGTRAEPIECHSDERPAPDAAGAPGAPSGGDDASPWASEEDIPEHLSPVLAPPSANPNAIGSPLADLPSEGSPCSPGDGSIAKMIGQRMTAYLENARRSWFSAPRADFDPIAFGFARADDATIAARNPFLEVQPRPILRPRPPPYPPFRPKLHPPATPITDRVTPEAPTGWIETKKPRFLEPRPPLPRPKYFPARP